MGLLLDDIEARRPDLHNADEAAVAWDTVLGQARELTPPPITGVTALADTAVRYLDARSAHISVEPDRWLPSWVAHRFDELMQRIPDAPDPVVVTDFLLLFGARLAWRATEPVQPGLPTLPTLMARVSPELLAGAGRRLAAELQSTEDLTAFRGRQVLRCYVSGAQRGSRPALPRARSNGGASSDTGTTGPNSPSRPAASSGAVIAEVNPRTTSVLTGSTSKS